MRLQDFNRYGFREGDAVRVYHSSNGSMTVRLLSGNALVDETGTAWIAGTLPYEKTPLDDVDGVEHEGSLENSH